MFRVPLSCSLFCEFSLFDLIKFSVLNCSMQALPAFSSLWHGLRTLSDYKLGPDRAHLTCFPSPGDYYLLLSGVQCHKKHCFIYFVCPLCLSYLRQRGILGPCCFTFIRSKVPPGDHLKIPKPRPHPQNK